MKKLLVLMLVLGMASMATAGLQISVMGNPDPVDTEYTLLPSEELMLDIHAVDEASEYYMLVVDNAQGSIAGGVILLGDVSGDLSYLLPYLTPYVPIDNVNGIAGFIGTSTGLGVDGIAVDQILFHCEGPDDALVMLYTSEDSAQWGLADTVLIHQIPEPMTMALLCLGGLFMRRRK